MLSLIPSPPCNWALGLVVLGVAAGIVTGAGPADSGGEALWCWRCSGNCSESLDCGRRSATICLLSRTVDWPIGLAEAASLKEMGSLGWRGNAEGEIGGDCGEESWDDDGVV